MRKRKLQLPNNGEENKPTTIAPESSSSLSSASKVLKQSNQNNSKNKDAALELQHIHGNFRNYQTFHPAESTISTMVDYLKSNREVEELIGAKLLLSSGKGEMGVRMLDVGCNSGELTFDFVHSVLLKMLLKDSKVINVTGIDCDPSLIQRSVNLFSKNKAPTVSCYFTAMDIMQFNHQQGDDNDNVKKTFDVITCFSTIMWIHLNNGDEGLVSFLRLICSKCSCLIALEVCLLCF